MLISFLKTLVPIPLKIFLRARHRDYVFWMAMREYLKDPAGCLRPESTVLSKLIYGWGNESWSALNEYLHSCIEHALTIDGDVLECGSGLSTILVGIITQRRNYNYWALEHTKEWAEKVQKYLDKYGINSVKLSVSNLKNYQEYSWYEPPFDSMPKVFALVICDGPPNSTPGGRYGFVPVMNDHLKTGCVVLLDDAERKQEQDIAERWSRENNFKYEILGNKKPYIRMVKN